MTSNSSSKLIHPIQWTKASASTCFPAPVKQYMDVPIDKILENLHPKWLNEGVSLNNAMRRACQDDESVEDLRWGRDSLHHRLTMRLWPGFIEEDHNLTASPWSVVPGIEEISESEQSWQLAISLLVAQSFDSFMSCCLGMKGVSFEEYTRLMRSYVN